MSGPNAPPMNRRMMPPGMTGKPMGADRIPMSDEPLQRSAMAQAIRNSIAARAGQQMPIPMPRPRPGFDDVPPTPPMPVPGRPAQMIEQHFEKIPKAGRGRPIQESVNRSAKGDPAVNMATKTIDEAGDKPPNKPPVKNESDDDEGDD